MTLKIKGLSRTSAVSTSFQPRDSEEKIFVAQYFKEVYGRELNFPNLPTVEVRKGVMLPLEICDVLSGQKYNSQSISRPLSRSQRSSTRIRRLRLCVRRSQLAR